MLPILTVNLDISDKHLTIVTTTLQRQFFSLSEDDTDMLKILYPEPDDFYYSFFFYFFLFPYISLLF